MRRHEERTEHPQYTEGDLVLVSKRFYERGTGAILPQSDGPYKVARAPSPHTAVLEDVFSGELYQGGKPVAVGRLLKFNYPVEWAMEGDATAAF